MFSADPNTLLPNEILVAIFRQLEPRALVQLALVSHRFNAVAEYTLYSAIVITDFLTDNVRIPRRTLTWCLAMQSRGHLIDSVKRVQIRWHLQSTTPPSPHLLGACDRLSTVLRLLVSLEHLELFLGPANYLSSPRDNIHAVERVLHGCRFRRLRYCSLGAEFTKGVQPYTNYLITFLTHTPSLRQLGLSDHHLHLNFPPTPQVLPMLQIFRGSAFAAASILPGRPVHYLSLIGQDSDVTRENLLRITQTTTPLRYLDLSAFSTRPVLLRNISVCLPTLERLRVRLALRHTLHYALSGIGLLAGLSSVLSAFPSLTHLDLSPTEGGRADPHEERTLCIEWSRACPSLRTIVFPSQVEWVLDPGGEWQMVG